MPRAGQTAALLLSLCACAPEPYAIDAAAWDEDSFATTAEQDDAVIGWGAGDTVPNLALLDQHGDVVSLYEHKGDIIVLELFAAWCASCQEAAPHLDRFWLDHADQGLVVLSPMMEDLDGLAPHAVDVAEWAAQFSLERPVLVGDDSVGFEMPGFPTYVVIDRNMVVRHPDLWPLDEEYIAALLKAH